MRIRFRFSKLGKIRFTSQRDVARMWERALRRARLPLAYTGGFSPRPQLSFGLALPTGCESLAEYLDVVLDEEREETATIDVSALPAQLTALLPDGIEVQEAVAVERRIASLQQEVTSCSWTMTFSGLSRVDVVARVEALLAAPTVVIVRERKGREEEDDLRPSVLALAVTGHEAVTGDEGSGHEAVTGDEGSGEHPTVDVVAELATQPRGVRPIELVRGLVAVGDVVVAEHGVARGAPVVVRACRTKQWIERDGVRWEPLELSGDLPDVDGAVHALERAS